MWLPLVCYPVAIVVAASVRKLWTRFTALFDVTESISAQLVIIGCITAAATVSVVSGLHVGIRRLSEGNLALFVLLLLFALVTGPTLFQAELFVSSLGRYLQYLPETSFYPPPWRTAP